VAKAERGLTLLDLLVVLALLALLVYLVGLDRRAAPEVVAPVPATARLVS
jgi:hypothetical protein